MKSGHRRQRRRRQARGHGAGAPRALERAGTGAQPQQVWRREHALARMMVDYGYDPERWPATRAILEDVPVEALEAMLEPGEEVLRTTWTTCSDCGAQHPELEPLDRPDYVAALQAARARDAGTVHPADVGRPAALQ